MADLNYHYTEIQSAIDSAREKGYEVEARSCCCGEGLVIYKGNSLDEADEWEEFSVD